MTTILMNSDRSPPSLSEETGPRTVTGGSGNGRWQEVVAPGTSCPLPYGGGTICLVLNFQEGKGLSSLSPPPTSAAVAKIYFYQLCTPLS